MRNPDAIDVSFEADFSALKDTMQEMTKLSDSFGRSLTQGLKAAVVQGKSLDQVLKSVALNLANNALNAALKPLSGLISGAAGSLFGGLGRLSAFSHGGVIGANGSGARVIPFAQGGVVSSPTFFPAGRNMGLMGEAGAEAILPLARGADGRLGVRTQGAGSSLQPISVTINTPDIESFRQSEAQLTASLTRAVQRGQRYL